jgi:hypothetical protein
LAFSLTFGPRDTGSPMTSRFAGVGGNRGGAAFGLTPRCPCEVTLSCATGHRPSSLSNLWALPRLPLPAVGTIRCSQLDRAPPELLTLLLWSKFLYSHARCCGARLRCRAVRRSCLGSAMCIPCMLPKTCGRYSAHNSGPAQPVGQSDGPLAFALPIGLLSGLSLFTHAGFVCVAVMFSVGDGDAVWINGRTERASGSELDRLDLLELESSGLPRGPCRTLARGCHLGSGVQSVIASG